jgi:hypothetical protein
MIIKRPFPPPAAPTLPSTPRHLQCPQRASAAAAASPAWAARRPALRTGGWVMGRRLKAEEGGGGTDTNATLKNAV